VVSKPVGKRVCNVLRFLLRSGQQVRDRRDSWCHTPAKLDAKLEFVVFEM